MKGWIGVVIALSLAPAPLARAEVLQSPPDVQSSSLPDPGYQKQVRTDSRGRKITTIDFDDAEIEGRVKAPEGFILRSREASKAESIMDLRKNFRSRIRAVGHEGLRAVPMR